MSLQVAESINYLVNGIDFNEVELQRKARLAAQGAKKLAAALEHELNSAQEPRDSIDVKFMGLPWGLENILKPPKEITLEQAQKGYAGAAAGSLITSLGVTASTMKYLPGAAFNAGKILWNARDLSTGTKATLAFMLPVATLATPLLAGVGGAGFGIYRGFYKGIDKGVGEAVNGAFEDVRYFDKNCAPLIPKIIDGLQGSGADGISISIPNVENSTVGAIAGGIIDGIGVGATTMLHTPRAVYRAYQKIKDSDMGPVMKSSLGIMVLPSALMATPVATTAGALYGAYRGYQEANSQGISPAIKNRLDDVTKYHTLIHTYMDGK
jgi:hypothetical protein